MGQDTGTAIGIFFFYPERRRGEVKTPMFGVASKRRRHASSPLSMTTIYTEQNNNIF
jgi:hypothetical protein